MKILISSIIFIEMCRPPSLNQKKKSTKKKSLSISEYRKHVVWSNLYLNSFPHIKEAATTQKSIDSYWLFKSLGRRKAGYFHLLNCSRRGLSQSSV